VYLDIARAFSVEKGMHMFPAVLREDFLLREIARLDSTDDAVVSELSRQIQLQQLLLLAKPLTTLSLSDESMVAYDKLRTAGERIKLVITIFR
jgi:hypothetical protein